MNPFASLEGEARRIADHQAALLARLAPEEQVLWADVAAFITPQRLQDKRGLLILLAQALAVVSEHPGLRPLADGTVRAYTRRSARLVTAYARMLRTLGDKATAADVAMVSERAGDLSGDIDLAAVFLEHAPAVLIRRGAGFLQEWHSGAVVLAATHWWAARGYLQAVGQAAHWLRTEDLVTLATLGMRVAERSRHAAKGLFGALPALVASMPMERLVDWVELGLRVAIRDGDLVLYMSYGSKRSHEAVEALARDTSFAAYRARISLLLEAFLGYPASVRSMFDLLDPASIPPDVPAFSDGVDLYVRPSLGYVGASPMSLYKLVALHALAHERFGSFEEDLLAAILPRRRPLGATGDPDGDRERFLLALAEDFRIDRALFHALPGLAQDADRILSETYGRYRADAPGGGVPTSPAGVRAHAAAFPFGLRLLADDDLAGALEQILAPLAEPGTAADRVPAVARGLGELLGPLWGQDQEEGAGELDLTGVPYPPFHDHLLLGCTLAARATATTAGQAGPMAPRPGEAIDLPGSLHPMEVIEGLEMAFRDQAREQELLLLDDDEEADEEEVPGQQSITYDEWDYKAGDHKRHFVRVRVRELPLGDATFVRETLARYQGEVGLIRRQFERLRPDRIKRYFGQLDGDELDLDALIEALVDRQAGAPMSDRVFIRRDKKERDVAVLFLLDMSDSTDQLVDDHRRVIDVEKEGLVILAEAIGQLDDQYAMVGFSSRGRNLVDVFVIKDFDDDYDESVAARIGGIDPRDYTRLGAALRYGTDRLAAIPAAARLLVLLSDGRPYDMGYGDLRYATEDTKMALNEARRQGVNAFCITVDPEGPAYLDDLFGPNRYTVIQNVGHLPTKLPRIYRNLTV